MCGFKDNNVLFYVIFCLVTPYITSSLLSDNDIIKHVLQKQSISEIHLDPKKRKHESHKPDLNRNLTMQQIESRIDIPRSFDARDKWPMCKSIHKVRNHKMCGAGWAFAAAATMSDRLCIQSNGTINIELSAQELVSCCSGCGGCHMGNSTRAWQFWVDEGLVSGGDYDGSFEGCKPYLESTAHYRQIPSCEKQCQSHYNTSYQEDKHFGERFYTIGGNISQIQIDIMTNGPVQAGLEVYEDFFTYRRGVYRHKTTSKYVGYTHVKLLGWGVERNVPYWLGVTSWSSDFGGLDGYVKILRGKNQGGIEANIIAGRAQIFRPSFSTTLAMTSPTCFYSISSISIMLQVSWWVLIVTTSLIFFSLFSLIKRKEKIS